MFLCKPRTKKPLIAQPVWDFGLLGKIIYSSTIYNHGFWEVLDNFVIFHHDIIVLMYEHNKFERECSAYSELDLKKENSSCLICPHYD